MSQVREGVAENVPYRVTLYVTGDTDLSRRAEANLRHILENCIPDQYILEKVDIAANPRVAMQDRVTITPMAAKTSPAPLRKVIGDFTDRLKVLRGLGIDTGICQDEQ